MDFFDLCSHPRAETYPYPLRPAAPEVADNLLVEVVDVAGLAVGEGEAYPIKDAARTAKHLLKLDMFGVCVRHVV